MQLPLVPDFPGLPRLGRKYNLQQRWATIWLRMPSTWPVPATPSGPTCTHSARAERMLAPHRRACTQSGSSGAAGRERLDAWIVGWPMGFQQSLTLSSWGGPDSLFPTSLWTTCPLSALSVGQTALPPACESEGGPCPSLPRATSIATV